MEPKDVSPAEEERVRALFEIFPELGARLTIPEVAERLRSHDIVALLREAGQ